MTGVSFLFTVVVVVVVVFQEERNVQHANKLFIMTGGKLHPSSQRKDGHITKPRKENSPRWWTF